MSGRPNISKGLDHIVVDRSSISWVGGETGDLVYQGYDVRTIVPGIPYESAVHLLLHGDPPPQDPSQEVVEALRRYRAPRPATERVVDALDSKLPPLDALRTILSAMGDGSFGYPPTLDDGCRLISQTPVLLARFVRAARGMPPAVPDPGLSHAANYLTMVLGERPTPERVSALESYLVLLADHGMNASTFALRTAISTQSDLASAATAALAVLKGPVHGGAPSRVSDMLDAVGSPELAETWVAQQVAQKAVLFGFGHRAYKTDDPRAVVLHTIARTVADPERLVLAESVERAALAALRAAHPGARLYTNVEFWSAVVLEGVGLPRELFTPTFAVARTAGWTAHALEQAADNRLIRPDLEYVGPPKGRVWPRPLVGRGTTG
ncbi:MAG: citrate synthase/methylcitrate synthase [Thermoplasmata archaeon]|nr:citrate synthase/methylcitrate synthase [Thermoplasmata archaeon]